MLTLRADLAEQADEFHVRNNLGVVEVSSILEQKTHSEARMTVLMSTANGGVSW